MKWFSQRGCVHRRHSAKPRKERRGPQLLAERLYLNAQGIVSTAKMSAPKVSHRIETGSMEITQFLLAHAIVAAILRSVREHGAIGPNRRGHVGLSVGDLGSGFLARGERPAPSQRAACCWSSPARANPGKVAW